MIEEKDEQKRAELRSTLFPDNVVMEHWRNLRRCQLRHQLRLDSERTDHAVYTKQSSTYDTHCV